ncbi:MAG: nucleotidyltransferase domain-containing protein [Clostridia bacterium]|nr:nucleotidyltransferase domain-containing protein [Clostridia bacterium]
MFKAEEYINSLTELLKTVYKERLIYIGLQGSYLRGEATENSDIDIMVVVDDITTFDLEEYRRVILTLPDYDKSCGFICGKEELLNWNPLEICHLVHTTKDYYGTLSELVPEYSEYDVRAFVKLSLGNLYHELCHRYIHTSEENNLSCLPFTYKSVFFILQNIHYLESGNFIATKQELLEVLRGTDKMVLDTALSLSDGSEFDFETAFSLLFAWCKEKLKEA